ncbi:Dihydrofolate reductase (EC 1.5.1.3), partial [Arthrobacter sp. DR-2P]
AQSHCRPVPLRGRGGFRSLQVPVRQLRRRAGSGPDKDDGNRGHGGAGPGELPGVGSILAQRVGGRGLRSLHQPGGEVCGVPDAGGAAGMAKLTADGRAAGGLRGGVEGARRRRDRGVRQHFGDPAAAVRRAARLANPHDPPGDRGNRPAPVPGRRPHHQTGAAGRVPDQQGQRDQHLRAARGV